MRQAPALPTIGHRSNPAAPDHPLSSFITAQVLQRELAAVAEALATTPEILEVPRLSGPDLLAHVVANPTDDLDRPAGQILDIAGVERGSTALAMRRLVGFLGTPRLEKASEPGPGE